MTYDSATIIATDFDIAGADGLMRPEYGANIIGILIALMQRQGGGDAMGEAGQDGGLGLFSHADLQRHVSLVPSALWDDTDVLHFQEASGLGFEVQFASSMPDDAYLLRGGDGAALGVVTTAETLAGILGIDHAAGLSPTAAFLSGDYNYDGVVAADDFLIWQRATTDILGGEASLVFVDAGARSVYLDDIIIGIIGVITDDVIVAGPAADDLDGNGQVETINGGKVMEDSIEFRKVDGLLPGDANLDGTVDGSDYSVWRENLGYYGEGLEGHDWFSAASDGSKYVAIISIDILDGMSNTLLAMQGADDGQWRVGAFSDVSGLTTEVNVAEAQDFI